MSYTARVHTLRAFIVGLLALSLTVGAAAGPCAEGCTPFASCERMKAQEPEPLPAAAHADEGAAKLPPCHAAMTAAGDHAGADDEPGAGPASKLTARDCCSLTEGAPAPTPAARSLPPEAPQVISAELVPTAGAEAPAPASHLLASPPTPPGDPPNLRLLLHQAFLL